MQHYLRPDVLATTNAETVTAWGQQFTKSETTLKPKMTGDGFDQVTRIGRYVNVPELMRINSAFTDTVQRDQLETSLPEVVGGDRVLLRRDPSPQVEEYVGDLADRIENLSASSDDNMLSITGDGRRVALDGRLVGLEADDDGGRSVAVIEQIMDVHQRTQNRQYRTETGELSSTRGGLQIVFLDQSTPRDEWNMYDQIGDDLVAAGMDGDKIRFIHEADTDEARNTLFNECRNGQVSVIIGSTQKMGTGTNIQQRAVALHHVDCPWRPADLEQREGRIIRQGNQNEQVELYSYATDKTFDVASWDMIARKAKFIGQMKRGELAGRQMEDVVAGLEFSASRAASELSGDPRIQELAELQLRMEQLESLQQTWQSERSKNRVMLRHNDNRIEYLAANMPGLASLADQSVDTSGERFRFRSSTGQNLADRADAGEYLVNVLRHQALRTDVPNYQQGSEMTPVGIVGNIPLGVVRHGKTVQLVVSDMPSVRREWSVDKLIDSPSAMGTIRTAEHLVTGLHDEHAQWQQEHDHLVTTRGQLAQVLEDPFEYAEELHQVQAQAQDLAAEMGFNEDDADEVQAVRTVSGQTLEDTFGEATTTRYRDNDVVLYERGYYRLEFVYDDNGIFQDMYGYPADEPRPEPLEHQATKLQVYLPMKVIERNWDQLTPMQQAILERDTDYDEHYRYAFELNDQDRVRFVVRDDPDTVIEGAFQKRGFITDDGRRFEYQEVDQSVGFVAVGKTSPQAQQAAAAERLERSKLRTASQLVPGEILTEDVEGFGYAGDVVRRYGASYRQSTVAVSPDTGRARAMELAERTPYGGRAWSTTPAMLLSDVEKQTLFGGQRLATTIGQLRPGDRVVSTDIDDRTAVKEMVTVLDVSGGDRKDVTYRGSDEVLQTTAKMESTAVDVHDRAKGALTGHELLHLAGHVRQGEPRPVQDVMDASYPGQHVFLEIDEFQPHNRTGMTGSMAATVAKVERGEGFTPDRLVLQTSSGDEIKLSPDRTHCTVTPVDQPVELAEVMPTTHCHVGVDQELNTTVPAGAAVTGSQDVQRSSQTSDRVTAETAEGPQQREPDRRSARDWLNQHVQVQHIGNQRPSRGIG